MYITSLGFKIITKILNMAISIREALRDDKVYLIKFPSKTLYILMESFIGLKCVDAFSSRYIVWIVTLSMEIFFLLHSISIFISYSYRSPLTNENVSSKEFGIPLSPVCVSCNFIPYSNLKICLVRLLPNLLLKGTSLSNSLSPRTKASLIVDSLSETFNTSSTEC